MAATCRIGEPRFDFRQLDEMKKVCNSHCLSTCQYVLGYYYNNANVVRWILKQGLHGWSGQRQLADA